MVTTRAPGAACGARTPGRRCRRSTEALDAAFDQAYAAVEPAGCKLLVALDVSGSMGWGTVGGIEGLSPREARTGYRPRSCAGA